MGDMRRHFSRLQDLSKKQLCALIARGVAFSESWRDSQRATSADLQGKSIVLVFEQPSTRTRLSFSLAIAQLGGISALIDPHGSQLQRGEPLEDTARVIGAMADGVVLRTAHHSQFTAFSRACPVAVINGLTDLFHPCQILADLITLHQNFPDLTPLDGTPWSNIPICWIGDGNNMCNTWIEASVLLGFPLNIASPEGYEPELSLHTSCATVSLMREPYEAAKGTLALNTDVWTSIAQDTENVADERRQAFSYYQINRETLSKADTNAIVLHCLPAHRGEEITAEIMGSDASRIWQQAGNRLHGQKALLCATYGDDVT